MITFRQLKQALDGLTESELGQTATVSLDISEEAIGIKSVHKISDHDFLAGTLDEGHVVLTVDF